MNPKIVEATNQRSIENHIVDASLVNIDIPNIIKQIKNEKTWIESDRNAITVFKTNGLSIVLIALHKNAEMKKHKTNALLSIQVIEGDLKFSASNETYNIKTGQILALHSFIEHSVFAVEETVFLLTITSSKKHFTD